MARQKEFDREEVLDRALDVFWSRGYEATSVQELVDAMGIQRGSLYGTFGDKRTLFLAALDRYEALWISRVVQKLENPGPVRDTIREVLDEVTHEAGCADRRGCFTTNSAIELAPHDPCVAGRVSAMLARVEAAFDDALRRGQGQDELRDDLDTRALARFLTSSIQGLRVMARAGADRSELRDVIRITLGTLG